MTQAIISFSLYTFKLLEEYRYHEVTGNCTIKFIKNMSFTIRNYFDPGENTLRNNS